MNKTQIIMYTPKFQQNDYIFPTTFSLAISRLVIKVLNLVCLRRTNFRNGVFLSYSQKPKHSFFFVTSVSSGIDSDGRQFPSFTPSLDG